MYNPVSYKAQLKDVEQGGDIKLGLVLRAKLGPVWRPALGPGWRRAWWPPKVVVRKEESRWNRMET